MARGGQMGSYLVGLELVGTMDKQIHDYRRTCMFSAVRGEMEGVIQKSRGRAHHPLGWGHIREGFWSK